MGASRLRREFLRDTLRAWRASRLRSVAKALRSSLGCGRCRPAVAACLENRSKLVALRASRCMMTFLFGCSGAFVRAPPTQMHCSCSGQASACINARVLGYGVVVGGLNVRAHSFKSWNALRLIRISRQRSSPDQQACDGLPISADPAPIQIFVSRCSNMKNQLY